MSYCRFAWGGSEVYVFESERGIECCGCRFKDGDNTFEEPEDMIVHLAKHRRAGHFVPDEAIQGLWDDIPGALRPSKPEPATLTESSIMFHVAVLQGELQRMKEEKRAET